MLEIGFEQLIYQMDQFFCPLVQQLNRQAAFSPA
jgi:hypothetical protein